VDSANFRRGSDITVKSYILSIALVILACVIGAALAASEMMLVTLGASLLLSVFLAVGIYSARTGKLVSYTGFQESHRTYGAGGSYTSHGNLVTDLVDARGFGAFFGILMMVFTVVAAATAWEIDPADVPSGVVLFASGVFAFIGAFSYKRKEVPPPPPMYNMPPPAMFERQIIREKEVIIKVRCNYCQTPFDEVLDRCPNCGAKR